MEFFKMQLHRIRKLKLETQFKMMGIDSSILIHSTSRKNSTGSSSTAPPSEPEELSSTDDDNNDEDEGEEGDDEQGEDDSKSTSSATETTLSASDDNGTTSGSKKKKRRKQWKFPFHEAISALSQLSQFQSPLDKLNQIMITSKEIELNKSLPENFGADELLPVLSFVITHAKLSNLVSELNFLDEFLPKHLRFELQGCLLVHMQVSMEFLKSLDLTREFPQ